MHCFTTSSLLPDWTDWNQVLHPLVIRTRLPSLCQRQDEHKKDRGLEVLRASVVLAALSRHWALGLGHWLLRNPPPPPPPPFSSWKIQWGGVREGENCRKCSLLKNIWGSGNGNRFRASRKTSLLSFSQTLQNKGMSLDHRMNFHVHWEAWGLS